MPTQRRPQATIVQIVLMVVVGGLIELAGYAQLYPSAAFAVDAPTGLLLAALAFYLCVIVHECGHAVFGFAAGYRLESLTIWPFAIVATGRRLRLRFATAALGRAVMLSTRYDDRVRSIAIAAGGPLANLASASVAFAWLVVVRASGNSAPAFPSLFLSFVFFFTFVSVYLGLFNIVPLDGKRPNPSDGALVLDAVRANARFRRRAALLEAAVAIRSGVRLRDIEPRVIDGVLAPDDGSAEAMRANLIAYAARASRDDNGAGAAVLLDRAIRSCAFARPDERRTLAVEAAVFWGWLRKDLARAERWAAIVRAGTRLSKREELHIDVALAWARGDMEQAIRLGESIARLAVAVPEGYRAAYTASVNEWIDAMRAHAAASRPPAPNERDRNSRESPCDAAPG